mgnify:CR=1 FL=1
MPDRFTETQRLGQNPIVRVIMYVEPVLLGLIFLVVGLSSGPGAWLTLLLAWGACAVALPALISRLTMTTLVTDQHLFVRWSWFFRKRVELHAVTLAEPARYDPISQAGGWGIKHSRKLGLVLNVFGDRGVAITAGDKRYMIGSQRPDELAEAILEGAIESSAQR